MLWSFTIATDTDDNIFSSIVNESRNRKARDEAWSYFCDASMFQYAFSTMTLSLSVYLAVLCAILSVKRRRLRRTGRETARGFERKNWRCFPPETSPLVFMALLPLFSLGTQKKLLPFEHGRDSASTQIFESSVPEPSLPPPIPHLGKYSAMFTSRILDWDKLPMEGNNRRKSQAVYGQRCNPKRENSTWRFMVASVFGCNKITVSSKEIASRFCQCW